MTFWFPANKSNFVDVKHCSQLIIFTSFSSDKSDSLFSSSRTALVSSKSSAVFLEKNTTTRRQNELTIQKTKDCCTNYKTFTKPGIFSKILSGFFDFFNQYRIFFAFFWFSGMQVYPLKRKFSFNYR